MNSLKFQWYKPGLHLYLFIDYVYEKQKSDSFNGVMLFSPDSKPVVSPLRPSVLCWYLNVGA